VLFVGGVCGLFVLCVCGCVGGGFGFGWGPFFLWGGAAENGDVLLSILRCLISWFSLQYWCSFCVHCVDVNEPHFRVSMMDRLTFFVLCTVLITSYLNSTQC